MKQVMKLLSSFIVGSSLLWPCLGAYAQADKLPAQPNAFTWGELSLLPEYCRDVQGVLYSVHGNGQDSPRAPEWVAIMGLDFWHMHHYCIGQRDVMRAQRPGVAPSEKTALLRKAVFEYQYVIKNCAPTMPVLPEVFLRLGELHLLLENLPAAQEAFAAARTIKPDYWPAYTRWIDRLVEVKAVAPALALAREGLRFAPDSAELQKRAAQLGGGRYTKPTKPPASAPTPAASTPGDADALKQ